MANYFEDNDDLRWYFDRGLDWKALYEVTEFNPGSEDAPASAEEALELYRDVLSAIGEFSGEVIAPLARQVDHEDLSMADGEVVHSESLTEIFDGLGELEVFGMCLPREFGGMNLPFLTYITSIEVIGRADVSVVAHYSFHGGIALALLMYSVMEGTTQFDVASRTLVETRWREAVEEIGAGQAWGSMDLTEPDAGSDLARLRTKAVLGDDGIWRVTGQKIYITSGHGKYHLVLARTEEGSADDPFAGLKGLSLFLVKAYEDTPEGRQRFTTLDGIEDKLGHKGSATVAISYEETPADLVGARGEGFKMMLLLMNNARVGVGFESLGLCEAARRMAESYAAQRPSMGKMIARHEMIADDLERMKTECQAIRALGMKAGFHEEMSQKLRIRLQVDPPSDLAALKEMESQRAYHAAVSRKITPLVKYYGSERAVDISRRALQIHGGCGYTKDYEVEKLLRDALVFPIYEGTSQIQGLMVMKDTLLGVIKNPQAFGKAVASAQWRALSAADPLERRVAKLEGLAQGAVRHLMMRIFGKKVLGMRGAPLKAWAKALKDWDPKNDFAPAMLHAVRLTELLIEVEVAKTLLEQVQLDEGRREILVRWLERAEPHARYRHDQITTTGERLLGWLGSTAPAEKADAAK